MRTQEVVTVSPIAVKVKTAAAMLEIGIGTMYQWLREGRLKSVYVGEEQRVEVAELQRFLDERRTATPTLRPQRTRLKKQRTRLKKQ